jgi:uncharacterized protein YcfL
MKKTITLPLILLGLTACAEQNTTMELHGKIYMKGSMPHAYLVLEESQKHTSYRIINPEAFSLQEKQKKAVTLKATLVEKAKGPGFPATIKVVAIED